MLFRSPGGLVLDREAAECALDGIDPAAVIDVVNAEIMAAGAWVFAGGLESPEIATVVSAKGSDIVMTDGPFGETKEHLGGFWIIDVPDLDAALEWAKKATVACMGPVEVRPFQDDTEALNND